MCCVLLFFFFFDNVTHIASAKESYLRLITQSAGGKRSCSGFRPGPVRSFTLAVSAFPFPLGRINSSWRELTEKIPPHVASEHVLTCSITQLCMCKLTGSAKLLRLLLRLEKQQDFPTFHFVRATSDILPLPNENSLGPCK